MTPDEVERHFTGSDGSFRFARWSRPIVPVVFGVDDGTLAVVKAAIEAVVGLAGHGLSDTDPEMGANLMMFFVADWSELTGVPELDGLVPELADLVGRLDARDASQYRLFRFEADGSIRAAFVFLRMKGTITDVPADSMAIAQAVRSILAWGDLAFAEASPMARIPDRDEDVLRPEIAALIRAAYDPILPAASTEPAHALRLFARMEAST